MAEKGRTWSDRETRLLLELWSEDRIQRQLQSVVRNENVFHLIVEDLAKRGFERTVAQCRDKIKALKKKYKAIKDGMRRSGTGQESDGESDRPVDFPYYHILDSVMGGRAAVVPVDLLDSATKSPATTEVVGEVIAVTEIERQPLISGPSVSSQPSPPNSCANNQAKTPSPSASSEPSSPCPSASSRPITPSSSATSQPIAPSPSISSQSSPVGPPPDDDTPVPKKKRKRTTNVQRAEKAASLLVKDVLAAQAKERAKRDEAEKERVAWEEMREKCEEEREQKYMESIGNVMSVMSQFIGSMLYASGVPPAPPPYMPPSTNVPPMMPFHTSYPMYPHTGFPVSTATSTGTGCTQTTTVAQSSTADVEEMHGDDSD